MNRSHVTITVLNLNACLQRGDIIIAIIGNQSAISYDRFSFLLTAVWYRVVVFKMFI